MYIKGKVRVLEGIEKIEAVGIVIKLWKVMLYAVNVGYFREGEFPCQ